MYVWDEMQSFIRFRYGGTSQTRHYAIHFVMAFTRRPIIGSAETWGNSKLSHHFKLVKARTR